MVLITQGALFLFMAGTLFAMGLGLTLSEAAAGLSRRSLLIRALLLGFVGGPALAWLIAALLPISAHSATALYLLAFAPCAPFLPVLAERAGAPPREVAAIMLVLSVATVIILPVAVPFFVPGTDVAPSAIARPLVTLVLAPLVAGLALRHWSPEAAARLLTPVALVARLAGIVLLGLCLIRYGRDILSLYGGFGLLALLLFQIGITGAAALGGHGLAVSERTTLTLGMTTRNVGASLAPLVATAQMSGQTPLLILLAIPVQLVAGDIVIRLLNRTGRKAPS